MAGPSSSFLLSHGSKLSEGQRPLAPPFTNYLLTKSSLPPTRIDMQHKSLLMERVVEERRNLSFSHRVLMMERRKMRQCESIDVSSLLPVIDPRGKILEETVSSDVSEVFKQTPKQGRSSSQNDTMTGLSLTVDKPAARPAPRHFTRSPLPVHNLNEDCGLHGGRFLMPPGAPTGFIRSRPMTEAHPSHRPVLDRLQSRQGHTRPTSLLIGLDMEPKSESITHWIHSQRPLRSSINYIEDIDKRRAKPSMSQEGNQKRRQELSQKEARKKKRSLELLAKVHTLDGVQNKASRNVFDEGEIGQWRSGRLRERP